MTKDQLDAIQEHVDFDDITIHDVIPLLAEVKRLMNERDRLTGLLDKVSDNHIASQLNGAREAIARKAAEAEAERLMKERDAAQHMLEGICGEFERTIRHADWVAAGSKGMSVPFHGDFASVAHLPSIISRMRWWAREMRRVITGEDK